MSMPRYMRGDGIELVSCERSAISYPMHNHVSVYTLGLVLDGAVELATDKGSHIYQKNESFVVLPYTPHRLSARPCYTLLSLCIRAELLSALKSQRGIPAIADFLHDSLNQPAVEEDMLKALSGLILISGMMPVQKETAVSKIRAQLERHPEARYSLEDMAAAAFLGKYEFIRVFKHETGLTPHQFQLQNRIRKAQRLLEGSASITEAALATGFCDQSHFTRYFERIVGLTPGEYRLACKPVLPVSAG